MRQKGERHGNARFTEILHVPGGIIFRVSGVQIPPPLPVFHMSGQKT
jgi:hypothetical protein